MFGLNAKQWDNIITIHILLWLLSVFIFIYSFQSNVTDYPFTPIFRFIMSKIFGGFFDFISSIYGISLSLSMIVSMLIRGSHPNRPENKQ